MKHDRLFQIIYALLEKKKVSAPDFAKMLGVSVRTIYRDVETLSESGIPIYAIAGKDGGISLMPGYTFDSSLLSDKEHNEILFALQSLQAVEQGSENLLNKLKTVFKKEGLHWIEVDFSRWGHKKVDTEKFNIIREGILGKQIIHMQYLNSFGECSERSIKAIKLIFKQKNWYLQAFCLKANDFRTFKIHRIASLVLKNSFFTDTFENLPSIDESDSSHIPMFDLKLKVSKSMAFRLYDEFSPSEVQECDDGSLIVATRLPIEGWLCNYVLSFGENIEIIEPEWLKDEMIEYIKKLQLYFSGCGEINSNFHN